MTSMISTPRLLLALVVWLALVLAADANDAPIAARIVEKWQTTWTAALWSVVAILGYVALFTVLRETHSPKLWRVVLRLWLPLAAGLALVVALTRFMNLLPDSAHIPALLALTAPLPMLRGDGPRTGVAAGLVMYAVAACAWRWPNLTPILTLSLCIALVLLSVFLRRDRKASLPGY